jgi:hypothetical protein
MPWFICEIERAGPVEDGEIYVMLTDKENAFASRWFRAQPAARREVLAITLAAISTGLPVGVALSSTDVNSVIDRMYIKKR